MRQGNSTEAEKMLRTALVVALVIAITAGIAFADSETRPATEAEKSFFNKNIAACTAAVANIKLWEKVDESGHSADEFNSVSTGSENMPLVYHYYIEWADQPRIEKANDEISVALAARLPEDQETKENQDVMQLEELAGKIAAAATAGNQAEVERLNKIAEEISARSETIFAETDLQFKEVIEKLAARDARAVARIGVNQFYQGFDSEPVTGTLADGTTFYRVENGRMYNESWVEGTSYVLLGKDWKRQNDDAGISMEKPEEAGKPHTTVQSLVIAVEAEQKRANDILNSVNLQALKALLEK